MRMFRVIRKSDNRPMFSMACNGLPYSVSTLESMSKSGYIFNLDGENVSLSVLLKRFSESGESRQAAPASANDTAVPESKPSKKVRCIETGEIYETQSAAAKALHIDPAQVSDSIKTGKKRSGYTFERVV